MATVRERGQLILITGLALAISLVVIALVLNSAIYTHNLASRYDSPGDDVVMANHDAREGAGAQIRHVNDVYADQGYSTVLTNYQNGLPDVEAELTSDAAINGHIYRVKHVSATEGVRIVDEESAGSDFTSRTGATAWTVVADGNVRSFEVVALTSGTVSETTSNVLGGLLGSSAFTVAFDDDADGSDEWRVAIYEDDDTIASDISVTVEDVDAGTFQTCTVAQTRVEIDFTRASVGSQSCPALTFIDGLSGPYDIRFEKAGNIEGSYRMVVDSVVDGPSAEIGPFTDRVDATNYAYHCGDTGSPKATFYEATSSSYPRISPGIYATEVRLTYDSDDMTYEGTQRVAPGELSDPPVTPQITSFTVTEDDATNDDDGRFTVSWTATDPNGNLDTVQVEAVDGSGDATTTTTSGTTLDLDNADGPYTFTVTAQDTDGNARSVTQTHTDDGDETGCPP